MRITRTPEVMIKIRIIKIEIPLRVGYEGVKAGIPPQKK
jgi:hypothetical protein